MSTEVDFVPLYPPMNSDRMSIYIVVDLEFDMNRLTTKAMIVY